MMYGPGIFCCSNPAGLLDALWTLIDGGSRDFSDCVIFLPSRRAVRSVEKMLVQKSGGAVLLPLLVPLGQGDDDIDEDADCPDVISNSERVIIMAKLLSADPDIRTMSNALPIARDLVRCLDYLENEGTDSNQINWLELVDEKYAAHFQRKAEFLSLASNVLPTLYGGRITGTQKRNSDIRGWINKLSGKNKVIVCGSTASVPATADLMAYVAGMENGYIILPGKISGRDCDFELDTNPYNSEYKFLNRIGVSPDMVRVLDVGFSDIDFFNFAFGNVGGGTDMSCGAQLIECPREAVEADVVAQIAAQSVADNKTVLIITPDAAGNQRISESLRRCGMVADFSGGVSGAMTPVGRAILNAFDEWIENKDYTFDTAYRNSGGDLFRAIVDIIETKPEIFAPKFEFDSDDCVPIWTALGQVSDVLYKNGIELSMADARAIIADCLSGVSIRPPMMDDAKISVLGTIESRMQSGDVVILTGLNEGIFPSAGYENNWLPRGISEKIGLPSPDRKVSLMALDFMNLSCGGKVYWTRSKTAGASQTTESRFLSRVAVAKGHNGAGIYGGKDVLDTVLARDNVPFNPLDNSAPRPPADRSDVYVTELELLIHNPYAFYVRHILRLRPMDDYWTPPDARDFGNLVHGVIEECAKSKEQKANVIIDKMDTKAKEILPDGSVVFHFWHKRFVEIAPAIVKMLRDNPTAHMEIRGDINIAGRRVFARADMIGDGVVLDIKTGAAPSKKQLELGNMPQLPLTAYILQNRGFAVESAECRVQSAIVMQFLQLKNNDVKLIEYSGDLARGMITNSVQKISELFGRYSKDFEPYEYYETSDPKYRAYDDLARIGD